MFFEHLFADVVTVRFAAWCLFWESLSAEKRRQLAHLRRIGAAGVQQGAAGAVDGARVVAVQRQNIAFFAGRIVEIEMRQALPAAADADDLAIVLRAAIDHFLDD